MLNRRRKKRGGEVRARWEDGASGGGKREEIEGEERGDRGGREGFFAKWSLQRNF